MTQAFQDRLSELFREMEVEVGTTNLSLLVLESFESAVKDLCNQDLHDFYDSLVELAQFVNHTEPRFAMLIDIFYEILKLAHEEEIHHPEAHFPLKKQKFVKRLEQMIRDERQEERKIIENAKSIDVEGKEILVHDNSRTILRVLSAYKRDGKHFRVIVAEQDPDKTGPIIENLHAHKIPFRVVPSYMISHLNDHIDMVFLGGLTLKSTMDFVMDPGTNALVSQFHVTKKPIYIFMATSKFSMWKSKKRIAVYKHVHRRKHHCKPIDFERIKFSHDRVSASLMKKVVTEEGAFTPKQVEKLYSKKLKERAEIDKQFKKSLKKMNGLTKGKKSVK